VVRLKLITWIAAAIWALLIITGAVVPLGLSDPVVLASKELAPFEYVADNYTLFGSGTTSRDGFSFTRVCTLSNYRSNCLHYYLF